VKARETCIKYRVLPPDWSYSVPTLYTLTFSYVPGNETMNPVEGAGHCSKATDYSKRVYRNDRRYHGTPAAAWNAYLEAVEASIKATEGDLERMKKNRAHAIISLSEIGQ